MSLICALMGHDCTGYALPPGWSSVTCKRCGRTVPVYRRVAGDG